MHLLLGYLLKIEIENLLETNILLETEIENRYFVRNRIRKQKFLLEIEIDNRNLLEIEIEILLEIEIENRNLLEIEIVAIVQLLRPFLAVQNDLK